MLPINTRVFYNVPENPVADGMPGTIIDSRVICNRAHYLVKWDNGAELWVHEELIRT